MSGVGCERCVRYLYTQVGADPFSPAEFGTDGQMTRCGLVVVTHDYEDYDDEERLTDAIGYLDDEEIETEDLGDGEIWKTRYGRVFFDAPFVTWEREIGFSWLRPATPQECDEWVRVVHAPSRIKSLWTPCLVEAGNLGAAAVVGTSRMLRGVLLKDKDRGVPELIVRSTHCRIEIETSTAEPPMEPQDRAKRRGVQAIRSMDGANFPLRSTTKNQGWFYLVRPVPELPRRIKLGFSVDLRQRMHAYRTANPTLELIAFWECGKNDERWVIDRLVSSTKAIQVGPEVFDVDDDTESIVKLIESALEERKRS